MARPLAGESDLNITPDPLFNHLVDSFLSAEDHVFGVSAFWCPHLGLPTKTVANLKNFNPQSDLNLALSIGIWELVKNAKFQTLL